VQRRLPTFRLSERLEAAGLTGSQEVVGSNPAGRTSFFLPINGVLKNNRFFDLKIGAVHQCTFEDTKLQYWNPLSRRLKRLKRRTPNVFP